MSNFRLMLNSGECILSARCPAPRPIISFLSSLLCLTVQRHGSFLEKIPELSKFSLNTWDQFPLVTGVLLLQFSIVSAFAIEFLLGHKKLYEPVGMSLHQMNAHSSLVFSALIVWNFIERPAVGGFLLLNAAITWMKLISYALANQDYRLSSGKKVADKHNASLAIIDNLDSGDFEMEYPRYVLW